MLLVVGGGPGTLTTVTEVLEKKRSVIVLANSGFAARDIYNYVEHDQMPRNDLAPDAKGCVADGAAQPSGSVSSL